MDNVSQIKQKLDIVDVIGSYVSLKKSGRNYKGLCPFHGEKTPSFMVSRELQIFKCFGCSEGGDMFNFVEKIEGVDFSQALEQLAEKADVKLEKKGFGGKALLKNKMFEINELTANFYHHLLTKHASGKKALKYVKKKRKFSGSTIKTFNIGYAPKTWDLLQQFLSKRGFKTQEIVQAGVAIRKTSGKGCIDKFRNRVVFPLKGINNKIVGFTARALGDNQPKYLNTQETLVFQKNAFLYGLDRAKVEIKQKGAVCVEGSIDVITAFQEGIKNVVAPLGTALTINQLKTLSRYTQDVTFCFDPDPAGIAAAYRAISVAEKQNFDIKVVSIPKTASDLDDLILKNPSKARLLLKNAASAYDFFIADNLKKFSPKTAVGKKKIIENLKPLLSRITNKILLEHYTKHLSEELNISEDILKEMLKTTKKEMKVQEFEEPATEKGMSKTNVEMYFVALLLKSDIDTIKSLLYNLKPEDFESLTLSRITKQLKKEKKKINVRKFIDKLEEEVRPAAEELFLWEIEPKNLGTEVERAYKRVKRRFLRKSLQNLSKEIKLAEMQEDTRNVADLTTKFEKLKKKLL